MTDETLPDSAPAVADATEAAPETVAADTPPDRLSTNPRSPWFDAPTLGRGIGIRLNGVEKTTVDEYCVSEGWVRVSAGKSRDRQGNPMTLKLNGTVEPYFRDIADAAANGVAEAG